MDTWSIGVVAEQLDVCMYVLCAGLIHPCRPTCQFSQK